MGITYCKGNIIHNMYSISIKLGDTVFESKGDSMSECLSTLPKPIKINSKASVTLTRGGKVHTSLYMPARLRKVWYKTAPMYLSKQFELLVA